MKIYPWRVYWPANQTFLGGVLNFPLEMSKVQALRVEPVQLKPDAELDAQWAKEADDRLTAYRRGEIQAANLSEVISKYQVCGTNE